jgi:chemotaxis protein methyltransferase CheR
MGAAPHNAEYIELSLLLEGIYQCYGYDFRHYARATVERRMAQLRADHAFANFSEVTARMLRDEDFYFQTLLGYFSISVTSFFRDPPVYRALREQVIPLLRTWPNIKVWHAGCATGEEVYSLGVLLAEAGILGRTRLFGTDISAAALETARVGIYPAGVLRTGSQAYAAAGGLGSLAEHYVALGGSGIVSPALRERTLFTLHNLVTNTSFGEMQLIVCRNVLIYFDDTLHQRVLQLFWDSLDNGGMLCLGESETLGHSAIAKQFVAVDEAARIYKKRVP